LKEENWLKNGLHNNILLVLTKVSKLLFDGAYGLKAENGLDSRKQEMSLDFV